MEPETVMLYWEGKLFPAEVPVVSRDVTIPLLPADPKVGRFDVVRRHCEARSRKVAEQIERIVEGLPPGLHHVEYPPPEWDGSRTVLTIRVPHLDLLPQDGGGDDVQPLVVEDV